MKTLNSVDYSVIILYFVVLLVAGLWLTRRASASLEDYFLGGRKLPWWALGMSGTASWFDMTGTMVIVSFLYMLGPRGLYIAFRGGAVLVLAFMMAYAGKWHRRSGCITVAEWMGFRFGEGPGGQFARIMAALSMVMLVVGMIAYLIKGVGSFLTLFFPFTPIQCALGMIVVATIYTMASGFYGVVVTDVIQTFVILIAVVYISVLAIDHVHDVPSLDALAEQVTGVTQWTSAVPAWKVDMPPGYEAYDYLITFAFFYLIKNIISGLAQGGDQHYFGARSERDCGLLSLMWVSLISVRWPMMIGFAVLGLFLTADFFPNQHVLVESSELIQQYEGPIGDTDWDEHLAGIIHQPTEHNPELIGKLQALHGEQWQEKLNLLRSNGTVNPERILPAVLLHRVPMGLRGLLLIALLAASMSTFDTSVNWATSFFTRDFYQRFFRPAAGNRELIVASYGFALALVLAAFGLAGLSANINKIWDWIIMGLTSGLFVPMVLRLYWWRFNASGVVASAIVGIIVPVVQYVFFGDAVDPRLLFVSVTFVTFLAAIVGTYLRPPSDWGVLQRFYQRTRPFGLWGPLKATLPPDALAQTEREHRNDLISVPFIMVAQVSLFMLAMLFIIEQWREFGIVLVIFLIAAAGVYKFWYKNLPPPGVVLTTDDIAASGSPDAAVPSAS